MRLEVELKKEREKDSLHIQRLLYISLFVSISTFSPQLPRMYKQTNKRTMCRVFLTWKDIPTVADMSIDTQLKFASCYQPIYLCTVMLLCVLHSSVSY